MSTATTQQQGFAEAAVQKMPSLACIGVVDEVGEGKLSSTGNYVVQPIKLRAHGPGRNLSTNILYRPEWLDPNFDPNSLEEYDNGASMLSVYRRNINEKGRVSALKGLCGSDESFSRLAAKIFALPEKTIPAVQNVLRDHLTGGDDPVDIIYVLKQKKDKAGEDENGKTIYELAQGYEVGEYQFATTDNVKKLTQRANRPNSNLRIAFDVEG